MSAQGGACSVQGVCLPGRCLPGGVCLGGVCPWGCLRGGGSAWGHLLRGCVCPGVSATPPRTESQTPVKTQPCRNYVADGNNNDNYILVVLCLLESGYPMKAGSK